MPMYRLRKLVKTAVASTATASLLLIAACNSDFVIEDFPANKSYVGIEGESLPEGVSSTLPKLPATIEISYPATGRSPNVFINGQKIDKHVKFTNGVAVINTQGIKALLKQGQNTLQVDPNSFGPKVIFTFDNSGPELVLDAVENIGSEEQAAYQLTVFAKDAARVKNVQLERMNYSFDGGEENGRKVESISATGEVTHFTEGKMNRWESTSAVNQASLYKLSAEDEHGFKTVDYYLAPGQKLNNIFKLKLDSKLLSEATPLLKEQIKDVAVYAPKEMAARGQTPDENAEPSAFLDKMSAWWTSGGIFYSSNGAAIPSEDTYLPDKAYTLLAGSSADCGFADIDPSEYHVQKTDFACPIDKIQTSKKEVAWSKQYNFCRFSDMEYVGPEQKLHGKIKPGYCSRIYMTQAKVKDADNISVSLDQNKENRLHLETKVNDLEIKMGIRNIQCGFQHEDFFIGYKFPANRRIRGVQVDKQTGVPVGDLVYNGGGGRGDFCRDVGDVSHVISLGDMNITADSSDVKGDIDIAINDGKVDLNVVKGLKLGLDNIKVGNSGIDWILPILSGILNDLFVDIVEDTLKQNLADFILGFDLFTDQDIAEANGDIDSADPSMQLQAQAYQLWSEKEADSSMQWFMNYAGYLKTIKNNPAVDSVLGSYFVPEALIAPTGNSQVDLSLNSNLINQALTSMHLSGVTQIHILSKAVNGESVFFGPQATDDLAVANGTLRVVLIPNAPASFKMQQDDNTGTQAQINYRNAEMQLETYKNGQWHREIDLQVDMSLGVLMAAEQGKFEITILGTPDLTINTMRFKGKDYIYKENDNGFFAIAGAVVKAIVQKGVDLVLNIATPQITQNMLNWDWPAMPIEGTDKQIVIKTEDLRANNNRHLQFALTIEVEDRE